MAEADDLAQNWPLWRLFVTSGAVRVVQARDDDELYGDRSGG